MYTRETDIQGKRIYRETDIQGNNLLDVPPALQPVRRSSEEFAHLFNPNSFKRTEIKVETMLDP
jgi:hypothetical protein